MMREVDWDEIKTGDVVLGKNDGLEWEVTDASATAICLMTVVDNEAKGHAIPREKLTGKVKLVATAAEAMERAVAVAQVRLGGEVVGVSQPEGPDRVPDVFVDKGSLLAHLYLYHRDPEDDPMVYPEGTIEHVVSHHDHLHATGSKDGEPHVHDPKFYKASS